jgi:glycosyltransferase involved in cell wall biosynthesis
MVSIAMCTYNGAAYLVEQLESIMAQSYPVFEIVIYDDGSTDETYEILDEYRQRFPTLIKLYRNDVNLGPAKNFEKAIGACSGEVIALSDQDDVWCESKLKRQVDRLAAEPDLGLVFSNARRIDGRGRELKGDLWQAVEFDERSKSGFRAGHALEVLLRRPFVTGCTVMFRAELKTVCLPIGVPLMHDHWISLITAAVSRIDFLNEELVSYRQHASNEIGAPRQSLNQRIGEARRLGIEWNVQELVGFEKLLNRIKDLDETQAALIEEKMDFLNFRVWLWKSEYSRLQKTRSLMREMLRGRYGRWGNGLRTLAKDAAMLSGLS